MCASAGESVEGLRGFVPAWPVPPSTLRHVTRQRSIANLWRDATAQERPGPAYLQEVNGEWREVSWQEAAEAVDEIANGLLALGIAKGDAFALLGRTDLEWALFDFALALVGAVGAP